MQAAVPSRFPLKRQARIAVLASGRGSNLGVLADEFSPDNPLGRVDLVLSNRAEAGALKLAVHRGIEAHHIPWTSRAAFERAALLALAAAGSDLVCLAGFMRILSPAFVRKYEGRLLNIHPSLLPHFPGLNPQQQALDHEVAESGCSVHFVDAGVDTGRVILQRKVPVQPGDDAAALAERILEQEHIAYPAAVRLLLSGGAQ